MLSEIKSRCIVSQSDENDEDDGGEGEISDRCEVEALWDTGSTHTVISQAVVDACELRPTGILMLAEGVGDASDDEGEPPLRPTYYVQLMFPDHQVIAPPIQVAAVPQIPGADVLIGMDIVNMGDLLITNYEDTKLSFRVPAQERQIEF